MPAVSQLIQIRQQVGDVKHDTPQCRVMHHADHVVQAIRIMLELGAQAGKTPVGVCCLEELPHILE